MTEEEKDEPPKIIVDEDWKQKAAAEKQALEEALSENAEEPASAEPSGEADYDLPPASFPGLLQEFSTRALVSLGMVPNPFSEEAPVDLTEGFWFGYHLISSRPKPGQVSRVL